MLHLKEDFSLLRKV